MKPILIVTKASSHFFIDSKSCTSASNKFTSETEIAPNLGKECAMISRQQSWPSPVPAKVSIGLCAALVLATCAAGMAAAFPWSGWWAAHKAEPAPAAEGEPWGGQWHWVGSPEEQKRIIVNLYNRYCIRCHGIDGRGVWDIPDVPDFTNDRWQACRSDKQLVTNILEGRGACMPAFRGTLTLEEAWGMARYLRSFLPASETSRPDRNRDDAEPKKKPQ
jgi:mono/diheme cytochrome c family protein